MNCFIDFINSLPSVWFVFSFFNNQPTLSVMVELIEEKRQSRSASRQPTLSIKLFFSNVIEKKFDESYLFELLFSSAASPRRTQPSNSQERRKSKSISFFIDLFAFFQLLDCFSSPRRSRGQPKKRKDKLMNWLVCFAAGRPGP